ncbi:hypothetical protein NE865_09457 [Phthorimaea operculella]|nr:hypothetical protein NE865_09457 [Phthorimaea operculella]
MLTSEDTCVLPVPKINFTMPKVVFSYFPVKALGEGPRMLLAYGGQEFEDRRVAPEEWAQYKPHTPFGQMPVLEIDGKQYAQSLAIARYLGRKYGLNGADIEEDFEIDQNVEFLNDIRASLLGFLEIDGKQYAQSLAIARYLGRKYGLNGADIEEDFEIDQNVEFLNDIRASLLGFLEIDGKQYAQSLAIARYLGRKYGLNGADIEEDFEIDQNVEFLNDIRASLLGFLEIDGKQYAQSLAIARYLGRKYGLNGADIEEDFEIDQNDPTRLAWLLEIDGKQYAQSLAIARYLGRKYGLNGADIEEDFEIDQNVEFLNDIRASLLGFLEIDGKQYAQSLAIARYLGRKYGLNGADIEEDFEIDQNVEFLNDIRASLLGFLEIDGKQYAQSLAIARYLGRKYGLNGADIEEDFEIDQNVEFLNDIRASLLGFLEIDGKQYAQSLAIARYLGRKYGLNGADIEEDFEIDQNVEFLNDIRAKAAVVQYEPDAAVKAKKHEDFSKNVYPALLAKMDQIITKNNGHIACGKLTWGDFVFAGIYDYLKMMLQMPDLDSKYPSFKKLVDNVLNLPKVKEAMPKVTFTYFPSKALGEGPRMLLAYGGQEFEDIRIPSEEWPKYKSQMPFFQMPVLEIDGKKYAQSLAIARYLGRKYGLNGADLEEDFEIDQNVYFINDIRALAATVQYEPDAELKEKKHEDFSKNNYPDMLAKLNQIVTKNNGHIACGKLTWGDFVFAGMYDYLKMMLRMPDLDSKYPVFKQLQDHVLNLPKVKEWVAQAPKAFV